MAPVDYVLKLALPQFWLIIRGVEIHPMKEQLRENPKYIPPGIDLSKNTSHEIRNALKKQGWQLEQTDAEIIVLVPGQTGTIGSQIAGEQPQSWRLLFAL